MKLEELEELEALCDDAMRLMEGREAMLEINPVLLKKLIDVAKAAKIHIEHWKKLAHEDIRTSQLLRTTFDPSYKPSSRMGLSECFEELEKE